MTAAGKRRGRGGIHPPDGFEGRPWRCATGAHILGQVVSIASVHRLRLSSGHLITGSAEIWCAECEAYRDWHVGGDGLEEMIGARRRWQRAAGEGEGDCHR